MISRCRFQRSINQRARAEGGGPGKTAQEKTGGAGKTAQVKGGRKIKVTVLRRLLQRARARAVARARAMAAAQLPTKTFSR